MLSLMHTYIYSPQKLSGCLLITGRTCLCSELVSFSRICVRADLRAACGVLTESTPIRGTCEILTRRAGLVTAAQERISRTAWRSVVIRLDKERRFIEVRTMKGVLLRSIDLRHMPELDVILATDGSTGIIKVPREYDLVSGHSRPNAPTTH